MGSTASRARRAGLGVLMVTACLLAALAPAAWAHSIDETTATATPLDGDVHWMNGSLLKTNGNYQYTAYWDAEDTGTGAVYLAVARRKLSDNSVQQVRFDGVGGDPLESLATPRDGHNTVAIGLSPNDGRIHVSFSNHHAPHHYWISSSGCMAQTSLSSCTWTSASSQADATHEAKLTYPFYINDREGHLYLVYRYNISLDSDEYINKYNDNGTWTAVGRVLNGIGGGVYDPDGPWTDTDGDGKRDVGEPGALGVNDRGVYMLGAQFDKNDRLHMMWMWREYIEGSAGWKQHGVYYAYSDDFGATWKDSGGTQIATAGSDPIKVTDTSTEVVSVPNGDYPQGWGMHLDPLNQPHVIFPASDVNTTDDLRVNLREKHVWRTASGTWYSQFVTTAGGTFAALGDFMFDEGNNIYFVYNRNDLGWTPWNSDPFGLTQLPPDHVTWQGGEYLNVVPDSAVTALDTTEYLGTPIGTGAGANRKITVRMKNNTVGTSFQLYWQTDADPTWTVGKGQAFTVSANDSSYQTYTFTVTDSDWTGTLRALEIYPAGLGDVHGTGKSISIDYVRITNDSGTVAQGWEFQSGIHLMETEAGANGNWSTWSTPFDPLGGLSDSSLDAVFPIDQQRYADSKVVSFPVLEQGAPGTERYVAHDFDILGDDVILSRTFDVDAQAWTAPNNVSGFGWTSDGGRGTIGGTLTGNDSQLLSESNLSVPTGSNKSVTIRLKNTTSATTARLWFITNADTTWNTTKSKTVAITANSSYTNYTFDMTGVSGWASNTLRQLRLDPSDDAGVTTGSFRLDRIYISP